METLKAIIEAGVVTSIIVVDQDKHADILGVLVPDGLPVAVGWSHDGLNFAAPPPVPPTAEQIAAAEALAEAKADAAIQYLITHTPAECYAYVQTNVTNLATAVSFLGKIAMVLSVIAKERLRV